MSKIVGMTQSNYIPWKGYFDYINSVDEFYFYDDVQYTKQDWRNRNMIKSPKGLEWISVPVGKKTRDRLICDVEITQNGWQQSHWGKIRQYYKDAPYFKMYKEFFDEIYLGSEWTNLSDMNQTIIKRISKEILDIKTKFAGDSRAFNLSGSKEKRYIPMLKEVGCTTFLSGPSAKSYLTPEAMEKEGIKLEWMNYEGYPEYHQLYPPFEHTVSILDLIFNEGPNMKEFMLSFKK
jgi:hypothetical protein